MQLETKHISERTKSSIEAEEYLKKLIMSLMNKYTTLIKIIKLIGLIKAYHSYTKGSRHNTGYT